jgi:Uma2 family endonuclease
MTAEQLRALPDDGRGYELVDGELIEKPPPVFGHGQIGTTFAIELGGYVRHAGLGQVVVGVHCVLRRNPDLARVPDVAFIQAERLPPPEARWEYFEGAPDLVVEIVSPSDSFRNMQEKVFEYLAAGVRLVWAVDPAGQRIYAYAADRPPRLLTVDDTLDGADVVPGFELPVRAIFE